MLMVAALVAASGVSGEEAKPDERAARAMKNIGSQMSEAERRSALERGTNRSRASSQSVEQPLHREGGTRGGGEVLINGEWKDINQLAPGADGSEVAEKSTLSQNAHNLDELEAAAEEDKEAQSKNPGMEGRARVMRDSVAARHSEVRQRRDNFNLAPAAQALSNTNPMGEVFAGCSDEVRHSVEERTITLYDQYQTCSRLVYPNDSEIACERWYVRIPTFISIDQDRRELLNVGSEIDGEICRVSRNLNLSQVLTPFVFVATLNMGSEESTKLCTRRQWAEVVVDEQDREHSDSIDINTEVGGLAYWAERRHRDVTGTMPQSVIRSLEADGQREGLLCSKEHSPSSGTATASESALFNVNVNTEVQNDLRCTVSRTATSQQVTSSGQTTAQVSVNRDAGTVLLGERWIVASQSTAPQQANTEVTASVNNEMSQNLCVRQVWPENGTTAVAKSKIATLGSNTETGGTLCTAQIRTTTGTASSAQTEYRTLGINSEGNQLLCTRNRNWAGWDSIVSGTVSPQACFTAYAGVNTSYSMPQIEDYSGRLYSSVPYVTQMPRCWEADTANWAPYPYFENGYQGGATFTRMSPAECAEISGTAADNPTSAYVCVGATRYILSQSLYETSTGNCSYSGQCQIVSQCTKNAPSGSFVFDPSGWPNDNIIDTYSVVRDNAAYRSVFGNSCISGQVSTQCSSTSQPSRWQLAVPNGTTSISNLSVVEWPDNAGTTVQVTETPSAANNWYITVTVTRTAFHYTPSNPQIQVTYNATVPSTSVYKQYNPNEAACSQGGTTSCPAVWQCNTAAPGWVDGRYVTTDLANTVMPLHWSSGNLGACLFGTKFKNCQGTPGQGTTISLIPEVGAVPSIYNFNINWINPDPRLNVWPLGSVTPPTAPSWNQSFTVTRTSWTGSPPAAPQVQMTWTENQPTQTVSVRTMSGDCAANGTTTCPAAWSCTNNVGMTSNGITVTQSHVNQVIGQLYNTAPFGTPPSNCAQSTKRTTCSGASTATTTHNFAALVQGQVNPRNFVIGPDLNGQNGISGTWQQVPSQANGWVGIIRVTRTDYSYQPQNPRFNITWTHDVTTTGSTVQSSGAMSGTGGPACSVGWECAQTAPFTPAGGVQVTLAMTAQHHPLYTGSPQGNCQRGSLWRRCSGNASSTTTVTLTGVPANATSVTVTGHTLSPAQNGVSATIGAPRQENGQWVVDVVVSRTNWDGATPSNPSITINWSTTGTTYTYSSTESPAGCRNTQGTTYCPVAWSCATQAPATINGINVTPQMLQNATPLYTGAETSCVVAELRNVCTGEPTLTTTVSLNPPAGTTSITDLRIEPTRLPGHVTAEIISSTGAPSWQVEIRTTRTSWDPVPTTPTPAVTLRWNRGYGTVDWEILTSNPCDETTGPSANCAPEWGCATQIPTDGMTVNGVNVTRDMIQARPRLWSGGDPYCLTAERRMECDGVAQLPIQELCIADLLPPNATGISNPGHTWINPIEGVRVIRQSLPSPANDFCYSFLVEKTDFDIDMSLPENIPQVDLFWDTNTTDREYTTVFWGEQSAGSPRCPTEWSCPTVAPEPPGSILWPGPNQNDPELPIDASQVSDIRPLLYTTASINATEDAPAACLRAELNRVCADNIENEDGFPLPVTEGVDRIEVLGFTVVNMDELQEAGVTAVSRTQMPTNDNGWVIRFNIMRTDNGVAPPRPQISVQWREFTSRIVFDDPPPTEGDCGLPGTDACPLEWRCPQYAPFTLSNGVELTPELLQGVPLLYPAGPENDDPTNCVIGELWRSCEGADLGVPTEVYIGGELDLENIEEIENVRFVWTNPDPRLTVEMVSPPSAPDWTAVFRVVRDYGAPPPPPPGGKAGGMTAVAKSEDPEAPRIELHWLVRGPLEWEHEIIIAPNEDGSPGSCNDEGTPNCPASWVCDQAIGDVIEDVPTTVRTIGVDENGNPVVLDEETSRTDLTNLSWQDFEDSGAALLYLDELLDEEGGCWAARKVRICQGSDPQLTRIQIADQIPPEIREITNFRVEIIDPGAGVAMNFDCEPGSDGCDILQAPTWNENPEESWVVVLRTNRTDFSVEAVKPEVMLRWELAIEEVEIEIQESGNCQVESNSFCNVSWVCTAYANGFGPGYGPGTGDDGGSTPPPAGERDLGELIETTITGWTGTAGELSNEVDFSIAALVGAGHDTVSGLTADVVDGDATVAVLVEPTAANGWTGQLGLIGRATTQRTRVLVRLRWYNVGAAPDPDDGGGDNGGFDGSELIGVPPLYRRPGDPDHWDDAPPGCVRAARTWDCAPITAGDICNERGNLCEYFPGGEFDECAEMERNGALDGCLLQRDQCTEDASEGGHCYIRTRRYACPREVVTQDRIIETRMGCANSVMGCLDGDCSVHESPEDRFDQRSTNKSWAAQAMSQNILTDWKDNNTYGVEPDPDDDGGGGGCEDCYFWEKSGSATNVAGSAPTKGAKNTEEPAPYDPWLEPAIGRTEPYEIGTPPPGFDPSKFVFFEGREYNCTNLWGCCKKSVAPQENREDFWANFGDQLRQNAAQLQSCATETETEEEGAHAELDDGATQATLNNLFTSPWETIQGGGQAMSCGGLERMEPVMGETVRTAMTERVPNLGWLCDDDEAELITQNETGSCSYIGDYCQTRILGICVDRRDRYCCFNSPMTRMLREDLAERFPDRLGLGTAKNPQCGGISPSDLSSLVVNDQMLEELAGIMVDGGAMDEFDSLGIEGMDWEAYLSGDLSSLGAIQNDPARQRISERTSTYTQGTNHAAARRSIEAHTLPVLPTGPTVAPVQEGQVSMKSSLKIVQAGDVAEIVVQRKGALNQSLSVRMSTWEETARASWHYRWIGDITLSWPPGDTSDRVIKLYTLKPVPRETQDVTLRAELTLLNGTDTRLYPNPSMKIKIIKEPAP